MRRLVLARFFNCPVDQVEDSQYEDEYVFRYDDSDYLVITEEEADKELREQIPHNLFQINPFFLKRHLKIDISTEVLQHFLYDMCENCRLIFWELIADKETFLQDITNTYGRGLFLAWYDRREVRVRTANDTFYYIYRVSGPLS